MYGGPWPPDDQMKPYPQMAPGQVHMTSTSASPFGQDPTQLNPPPYGGGYPVQCGYPPTQGGAGYPPMPGGYPPMQGGGYPPMQGGGYPPMQGGGYPPPIQGQYYGGSPLSPYPPESIALGDYGAPQNETGGMASSPYRQRQDVEASDSFVGFSDEEVRRNFIKKVYALLSIQVGITAAIVYPFLYVDEVQEFADDYMLLAYVFMVGYMVITCAIVCVSSLRRSFPCNLILLTFMTVFMGLTLGFITSKYNTQVVLIALGLTCLICVIVTFIACCAPIDITGCGMVLCVMTCGLLIFGLIASVLVIFFQLKILVLVYSGIAVVLFSLWLLYDTQQIMGGKRIELSPEEYILGTIQLYIDLVQIFMNLLPLVAACFGSSD